MLRFRTSYIFQDVILLMLCFRMSRIDIKNYLEKIYQVPVLSVRTHVMRGECPVTDWSQSSLTLKL